MHNFAQVKGVYNVGGLIGNIDTTSLLIQHCTNTGNIIIKESIEWGIIGGLISYINFNNVQSVTISSSINNSTITYETESDCDIGGLIGIISSSNTQVTIKDCTNNGQLNSNVDYRCHIGGLIGESLGELQSINNINNADVTGNYKNKVNAGGICGYLYNSGEFLNNTNNGNINATI